MLMRVEDRLSDDDPAEDLDPAPGTPLARVRNALLNGYDAPRIAAMVGCSLDYVFFVAEALRAPGTWFIPSGQPGRREVLPDLEFYDRWSR